MQLILGMYATQRDSNAEWSRDGANRFKVVDVTCSSSFLSSAIAEQCNIYFTCRMEFPAGLMSCKFIALGSCSSKSTVLQGSLNGLLPTTCCLFVKFCMSSNSLCCRMRANWIFLLQCLSLFVDVFAGLLWQRFESRRILQIQLDIHILGWSCRFFWHDCCWFKCCKLGNRWCKCLFMSLLL